MCGSNRHVSRGLLHLDLCWLQLLWGPPRSMNPFSLGVGPRRCYDTLLQFVYSQSKLDHIFLEQINKCGFCLGRLGILVGKSIKVRRDASY